MLSQSEACIIQLIMNKTQKTNSSIAANRKAFHDYFIEDRLEAGVVLEGWEVKSLRAGRVQLDQAYVYLKNGEVFLFGALITPLSTASTHINPDPTRTRKLLLHHREINKLIGNVERKGYTLIPLELYWNHNRVKLKLGLAKGKKLHDKREAERDRDWAIEKQRLLKKR